MTRLNSQQKEKVSQFRSITGSSDKVAQQCLAVRTVKKLCCGDIQQERVWSVSLWGTLHCMHAAAEAG